MSASNTAGLRSGGVMLCAYGHGTETETINHGATHSGSGQMVEASGVGIPVGITPART